MGVWEYVEVADRLSRRYRNFARGHENDVPRYGKGGGQGLAQAFSKMSDNRFAGVGVGCAVTALVQKLLGNHRYGGRICQRGSDDAFSGDVHNHGRQYRHDSHGANPCASILFRYGDFHVVCLCGVMVQMFAKSDTAKKRGLYAGGTRHNLCGGLRLCPTPCRSLQRSRSSSICSKG